MSSPRRATPAATSDFLFREVSYLLLSMASCSPEHVRLVNTEALGWSGNAQECVAASSALKYGFLAADGQNRRPKELVSAFLSDFHEPNKTPGVPRPQRPTG